MPSRILGPFSYLVGGARLDSILEGKYYPLGISFVSDNHNHMPVWEQTRVPTYHDSFHANNDLPLDTRSSSSIQQFRFAIGTSMPLIGNRPIVRLAEKGKAVV